MSEVHKSVFHIGTAMKRRKPCIYFFFFVQVENYRIFAFSSFYVCKYDWNLECASENSPTMQHFILYFISFFFFFLHHGLCVMQYPPFALIEMLMFMLRFFVLNNVHGLFMTGKRRTEGGSDWRKKKWKRCWGLLNRTICVHSILMVDGFKHWLASSPEWWIYLSLTDFERSSQFEHNWFAKCFIENWNDWNHTTHIKAQFKR